MLGTEWKSAVGEVAGLASARTMPTPPAASTALLLSTRSLMPRVQITILPATLAGSSTTCSAQSSEKQRSASVGSAPVTAALVARTSGLLGTAGP